MRGARTTLLTAALWLLAGSVAAAETGPNRTARPFEVTNATDGGTYALAGYQVDPPCEADTVVVLLHGLSYTGETWDFPGYSYARILADAGYAVVAIDRLGYGASELANGRDVTTLAHADMAAQVVTELTEEFDHVVLGGHSAGAETAVTAAGLYDAPVAAVVPMGYHTYPDPEFLAADWIPGDQVNALMDDYVYFMGTPERRAEMFYTDQADAEVIAADTAAAVPTPSGEIQTISAQPSRAAAALVDVPVLAQLAEEDRLFPSAYADAWAAQFLTSPSATVDIVPGTGHTYMLHHAGPAAAEGIAEWLDGTAGLSGCTAAAADASPPGSADPPPASTGPTPLAGAPTSSDPTLPATGGRAALAGAALVVLALALRRHLAT